MKKLSLYIFLVLMFSFNINVSAWEKVPIPNYIDKKTKSPWNFFDDFEDQIPGKLKFKNYTINDKGAGKKPFKFKKDPDGNTYLEVTVKHRWNRDGKTERAEIEPRPKRTLKKEVWYGFKMRLPKDFKHIDDRLVITQYKNQFDPMKKSPLLGIRFYENGTSLRIGGSTGGIASKRWNEKEYFKHGIRNYYIKTYNDKWIIEGEKTRNSKTKTFHLKYQEFDVTPLGEWTTYKIGIRNSKKEDGFVKVYKDDQLIMNYEGITYDWNGNYTGSHIRIGPYRDSDRFDWSICYDEAEIPTLKCYGKDGKLIPKRKKKTKGHPPQSIHYDDFTIVSDKKTLDQYLK